MKRQSFSLEPFSLSGVPRGLKISGEVGRSSGMFSIRYELAGPLSEIVLAPPSDILSRRDALWEETCLEFFIGPKGSERYWEFNLSPSGNWNVYRFMSYRQGILEEPAFVLLPFSVMTDSDELTLSLKFDPDMIISEVDAFDVAISAVVKDISGNVTYWALTHPGPQPDFHNRESFIVEL